MQEYPVLKPCCSFLMPLLILPVILLSIILEKSLFTVLSSVIPLQLLHVFKSPFFATLIITPIFQSLGNPSSCQILINSGNTMSADVCASTFSNSPEIWAISGVLLFFRLFIATINSSMLGGYVFTFSSIILSSSLAIAILYL
jgi:hypothetical protein